MQSACPGEDEDNEGVMMIVMIMRRTMMWMMEMVIEMTVIVSETWTLFLTFFCRWESSSLSRCLFFSVEKEDDDDDKALFRWGVY